VIRLVDHINIATQRLDETRHFYVEVLGLSVGPRPPFSSAGFWLYAGDRPVVHLQQAMEPVGPSSASALNHIAFEVLDLDAMLARLDRFGVAYRVVTIPGGSTRQVFFEDPNGARLELIPPRLSSP
jgi:catechol 2,3-dioxygenase-like lactoylglutathione lyase family enzyme